MLNSGHDLSCPRAGLQPAPVNLRADITLGRESAAWQSFVVLAQVDFSRAIMALGRLGERIWFLFAALFVGRVFDADRHADVGTCLAAEDLASCVE